LPAQAYLGCVDQALIRKGSPLNPDKRGLRMTANTQEQLWNAYMDAFAAAETEERERLLKQSVSDDVVFTNPGGEGRTREGLSKHIADFRTKMPGCHFKTDRLISHHGECLAVWSMYKQDGAKVATGYNFVQFGADGRFSYMAGFF
jgi:SnoaL-like protein